jgi:hypothetical protein
MASNEDRNSPSRDASDLASQAAENATGQNMVSDFCINDFSNLVGPRAALAGSNPFLGLVEPSRPTGSRPKYFYPGVSPRDLNSLVAGKEVAAAP